MEKPKETKKEEGIKVNLAKNKHKGIGRYYGGKELESNNT